MDGANSVPRYLRAPPGSCHDFCKYGKKHTPEGKGGPLLTTRSKKNLSNSESTVECKKSRKIPLCISKSIFDSKINMLHASEITKQTASTKEINTQSSLLSQARVTEEKALSSENLEASGKKFSLCRKGGNFAKKLRNSSKSNLATTEKSFGLSGDRSNKVSSFEQKDDKSGVVKVKASSKSSLSSRTSVNKASKGLEFKGGSRVSPLADAGKDVNKIKIAQMKQPKTLDIDMVQEKTLYVIQMEANNSHLQPRENASERVSQSVLATSKSASFKKIASSGSYNEEDESNYTSTDPKGPHVKFDEAKAEPIPEPVKFDGHHGGKESKTKMVPPTDSIIDNPKKLCFQRGKVIDFQPESHNLCVLRFKKKSALRENQQSSVKDNANRSLRKREVDVDPNNFTTQSPKIVLRHHDVHGKKDEQGLFNNVIEETASKLAATRKSKVKALVGAFETVISLQDEKSSPRVFSKTG